MDGLLLIVKESKTSCEIQATSEACQATVPRVLLYTYSVSYLFNGSAGKFRPLSHGCRYYFCSGRSWEPQRGDGVRGREGGGTRPLAD